MKGRSQNVRFLFWMQSDYKEAGYYRINVSASHDLFQGGTLSNDVCNSICIQGLVALYVLAHELLSNWCHATPQHSWMSAFQTSGCLLNYYGQLHLQNVDNCFRAAECAL